MLIFSTLPNHHTHTMSIQNWYYWICSQHLLPVVNTKGQRQNGQNKKCKKRNPKLKSISYGSLLHSKVGSERHRIIDHNKRQRMSSLLHCFPVVDPCLPCPSLRLFLLTFYQFFYQLSLLCYKSSHWPLAGSPYSSTYDIYRVNWCESTQPLYWYLHLYLYWMLSHVFWHFQMVSETSANIKLSIFSAKFDCGNLSPSSDYSRAAHISSHIIGFVKIPWKWGNFEEGPLFVDTPIPTYN